jgi:hypothetical protein
MVHGIHPKFLSKFVCLVDLQRREIRKRKIKDSKKIGYFYNLYKERNKKNKKEWLATVHENISPY